MDNTLQKVPNSTVWKIVSVFGDVPKICMASDKAPNASRPYNWFNVQGFLINNKPVYSEMSFAGDFSINNGHFWRSTATCTGGDWDYRTVYGLYDVSPNPNILPMWLPAGTDVQAIDGSYLSVIEFNVK